MKIPFVIMTALCGALLGCNRSQETGTEAPTPATAAPAPAPAAAAPAAKASTMETIVDGFTGKAVIQKGNETRDKVKAISAKEQADLDEAMK